MVYVFLLYLLQVSLRELDLKVSVKMWSTYCCRVTAPVGPGSGQKLPTWLYLKCSCPSMVPDLSSGSHHILSICSHHMKRWVSEHGLMFWLCSNPQDPQWILSMFLCWISRPTDTVVTHGWETSFRSIGWGSGWCCSTGNKIGYPLTVGSMRLPCFR